MFEILLGLNLFLLFIIVGVFAIWIWAMIDIITSKFKEDLMQIVWLLVVFFLPFLGVLLYLIIGRSMKIIPLKIKIRVINSTILPNLNHSLMREF